MDTKLTLKLDKEIIEKAKKYASSKHSSLSNIIENYLNSLTAEIKNENHIQISPFVKSLASGTKVPVDLDYRKEYSNHLSNKYK